MLHFTLRIPLPSTIDGFNIIVPQDSGQNDAHLQVRQMLANATARTKREGLEALLVVIDILRVVQETLRPEQIGVLEVIRIVGSGPSTDCDTGAFFYPVSVNVCAPPWELAGAIRLGRAWLFIWLAFNFQQIGLGVFSETYGWIRRPSSMQAFRYGSFIKGSALSSLSEVNDERISSTSLAILAGFHSKRANRP